MQIDQQEIDMIQKLQQQEDGVGSEASQDCVEQIDSSSKPKYAGSDQADQKMDSENAPEPAIVAD